MTNYAGFANRGIATSRFNFLGMALMYPIFIYMAINVPIHRKLYTELIADSGDDGEYIRNCLSFHKPGLWKKLSRQLNHLDFNFKQNLVSKNPIEFPTNFISSRSLVL
jgi:hypothetical protein